MRSNTGRQFVLPFAAVGVALLLRWGLDPLLADRAPLILPLAATVVVSARGGLGPGLLATLLGALLGNLLFMPPRGGVGFAELPAITNLVLFCFLGVIISIFGEYLVRTQARLRRRTDELNALLDVIPAVVWIGHDPECKVITGTRAANELLGVPLDSNVSQTAAMSGKAPRIRQLKEDGSEYQVDELPLQRAVRTRQPVRDVSIELHLEDGRRMSLLGNAAPIFDTQGRTRGSVAAFVDLSAHKQAQEALRRSENRLAAALEIAQLGIWEYDPTADVAYLDERCREVFGLSAEGPIPNEEVLALIHPQDRSRVEDQAHAALDPQGTGIYESEHRVLRPDGALRWIAVRGNAVAPGEGPDRRNVRFVGTLMDITERKRAEEALRESESFYRQTLESIPGMVFTTRPDGYCDYQSQQWVDYTGVPMAEHMGDGWNRLLHPDDRNRSYTAWMAAVEGSAPYDLEYRIRRHDGVHEWFKVIGRPIRDEAGRIVRWFGAALNIEALKRAEDELAETHQRLEALMRALPVGVSFSDDPTCQRITGNPAVLAQFEIRPEDNLSASSPDASHPGRQVRYLQNGRPLTDAELPLQRAVAENAEVPPIELEVLLPSGRRWFADCSGAPVRDQHGRVIAGIAVTVDITHHKEAEAALARSEEKFRTLADNMSQFAWMADEEGGIFWYNRRWYEYTGSTPEEMEGWGWRKVHHPDHVQRVVDKISHCFRTGEYWEDTFPLRGRDGEYRWFLSRAVPIRDPQGSVVRWFGTNTDVTGQKRVEEELDVALQAAEQARAAAEAANRAKDHFLAVLSHELRTPLTPALTAAQVLEADTQLADETREAAALIRRNIQLEARLIDDLLDLTRISRGKLVLQMETLDLHQSIRQTLATCEADARGKQIVLEADLAAQHAVVQADPARLQQMLWNVVRNAIKFTSAGGSVRIRTEDRPGGRIAAILEDTGIGIDPGRLPHIFDAFEQGSLETTRLFGGLGLGLSITKGLAELHGGTIRASSDGMGKGARFELELPLSVLPLAQAAGGEPAIDSGARRACRILLVEDHRETAIVMSRLMQAWGHTVLVAHNVADALRIATASSFDLLISDVGLPDGTGHDLMRQLAPISHVCGIALSGYGMDEDIHKSMAAGFSEHLVKPVDFGKLKSAVDRATRSPGIAIQA